MALLAWKMVHGITKPGGTGRLPFPSNSEILKFAEFVVDHSLPTDRHLHELSAIHNLYPDPDRP